MNRYLRSGLAVLVMVLSISTVNGTAIGAATSSKQTAATLEQLSVTSTPEDAGVKLTWTSVGSGNRYSVLRSTAQGGPYTMVGYGITTPEYTDTQLLNGRTYYYRVKSSGVNAPAGVSSEVTGTPRVAAYSWDFNRPGLDAEGWGQETNGLKSMELGHLILTVRGKYARTYSPSDLMLDTRLFHTLHIRMRNNTTSTTAALRWTTMTDKYSWDDPNEVVRFAVKPNKQEESGYTDYTIELSKLPAWKGPINQLCVTPALDATGGSAVIDQIAFTGSYKPKEPLIGAIRWDAWYPNNRTDKGTYVDPTLYTDFSYRKPFYGWFNADSPEGSVLNHADIVEQEIQAAADGMLDYWAFDWYPENTGDAFAKQLMLAFDDYYASANPNKPKFSFIIQTDWIGSGENGEQFDTKTLSYLIEKFKNPKYVKVEGNRPLVFWFTTSKLSFAWHWQWQAKFKEISDACRATGVLGEPYYVDNNYDLGAAAQYGLQGVTSYGPSGASPGIAHGSWDSVAKFDKSRVGTFLEAKKGVIKQIPGLSPVMDPRPRKPGSKFAQDGGMGATAWNDIPTYKQWEDHVRYFYEWAEQYPGRSCDPTAMLIYSWNELDEGGPGIVPTVQDGTMFLDAIRAVKTGQYSDQFTETFDDANVALVFSGEWNHSEPLQKYEGYYQNDCSISQSTRAAGEFTHQGVGFEITGPKGPAFGTMAVYLDGVLQAKVDCSSASDALPQVLWSKNNLSNRMHRLKIVAAQGNICLDTIRVHEKRPN